MISGIIKVSVSVISLSLRLRLITLTSTLIIPDITKTSSNNCLKYVLCILISFYPSLSFFSFIYLFIYCSQSSIKNHFLFDGIFSAYGCSSLHDICPFSPRRPVLLYYLNIFKLLSRTNQMVVQKGVPNFLFQAILFSLYEDHFGMYHTTVQ